MNEAFRRRIKRNDRLAKWFITLGGMAIIFTVALILLLIVNVSLPLFMAPKVTPESSQVKPPELTSAGVLAVGIDDYLENAFLVSDKGDFHFLPLGNDPTQFANTVSIAAAKTLRSVEPFGRQLYALTWTDGSATLVRVVFSPFFDAEQGNRRSIRYAVNALWDFAAPPGGEAPLLTFLREREDAGRLRIDLLEGERLLVRQVVLSESLFGDPEEESFESFIEDSGSGKITALVPDLEGSTLYVGTDKGFLLRYNLQEPGEPMLTDKVRGNGDEAPITALTMVFGDTSLAVGDAKGRLSTWSPVRDSGDPTRFVLTRLHQLTPHPGPIERIQPSLRDKSLLSYSRAGGLHLDHMTSERHLLEVPAPVLSDRHFALSTRSDGLVTLEDDGSLVAWRIDNPHPEISFTTLFGKVWYEGYDEPVWAWQSSSASDDFEPKLSLTPLIFGTLKGTFYAMIFALPLALFGAIYTSQFCRPRVREIIKPMVEVMAAIPTVIIGFLAALWLAPIIEASIGAVFLSILFVPAGVMIAILVWQPLRENDQLKRLERGYEFLAAAPIIVIAVAAAFTFGPAFEQLFFGGDLKLWLFESLGTRYEPRNCIVIAFAMGFAVIPIIFTIAEDSLSNVPPSLKAASLACGASRWQTVWRVILPSASPGIFAGTMIGFGRAVGETMIVLMATGNTAIMDLSIFNGMRPLSSNIAVEIPEAPHGGTLYRVLFLSAVLLFVMTFIVNTAAEVIRQRLRAKYGRF